MFRQNSFGMLVVLATMGCATVDERTPIGLDEVTPRTGERIVVDDVFVLVDASGSTYDNGEFTHAKMFLESFVAAAPSGRFDLGHSSFGGASRDAWQTYSLQPFDRNAARAAASEMSFIGGITPLATALRSARVELRENSGRASVLVISDGITRDKEVIEASRELVDYYRGEVCLHTIQLGSDPAGGDLLRRMAETSPCGSVSPISGVTSPAGLEDLIRKVFFGGVPDSDRDGVPDDVDRCPGTPQGVRVDQDGCPLDSDGDGVYDYQDECPGTPAGVRVDRRGCPLDSDGDGVTDDRDQCPGTPSGANVDNRGCWVLENLTFDTDSAEIKEQFEEVLNEAARVLKLNPDLKIRIDGHTDSSGSETYNQALSERRAQSVRDALVMRGGSDSRLTYAGFGESQPAVPNTSPENMRRNRRVELTPLE